MPDRSTIGAVAESAAGEWIAILSLVFGGCCSNVWALEAVLKSFPSSGTFLTFAQFLYVTFQTLPSQIYFKPGSSIPRWRKNEVPLSRWMVQVVLFFTVNLMNNYAFGLKIPVTVHIIFRSGGLCVSMLTGYLIGGKRYSASQIFAGTIITAGIVFATISAPRPAKPKDKVSTQESSTWVPDAMQYPAGILLLALALFLSAWLGLWQEQTYKQYGKKWREALFYCHALSLPFFLPMYPSLSRSYTGYMGSPPLTLFAIPTPDIGIDDGKRDIVKWRSFAVPSAILALLLNVVTQGLCIRGVNRLTTRVSSTTVNLILTLRKAASLAISVWYYGSGVSTGLAIGGAMVLGGTMVYSMASQPPDRKKTKTKVEDDYDEQTHNITLETSALSTARLNGRHLKQRV